MDGPQEEEGLSQGTGRRQALKGQERRAGGLWGVMFLAAEPGHLESQLGRELRRRGRLGVWAW